MLHSFTLMLKADGPDEVGLRLNDAGCDDALVGEDDHGPYAAFTRGGATLADAVAGATSDVEAAGLVVIAVDTTED